MTNIPELTDDEATVLRHMHLVPNEVYDAQDSVIRQGLHQTEPAIAALAAYDAKKRAEIREDDLYLIAQMHKERGRLIEALGLTENDPGFHDGFAENLVDMVTQAVAKGRVEAMVSHFRIHPFAEWHEEDGAVLWFTLPIEEPPWCGTPNDDDWPWVWTEKEDTCWCLLPPFFGVADATEFLRKEMP